MIEKPTTVPDNKRINVGNPVNISSGANLTIDCIVTGTPPIMITWLRLSANEIIAQNTSTITIAVTNTTDGDDITCRADNNIGFEMATTTINVDGNFIMYINSLYICVYVILVFVVAPYLLNPLTVRFFNGHVLMC